MAELDADLRRWFVEHRGEPLDSFFVGLSFIGSYGLVWLAIAFAAAWFWGRYALFGRVLATIVTMEVVNFALKNAFDRDRPPLDYPEPEPLLETPPTPSFPSGHAAISFACATVIGLSLPRLHLPLLVLAGLIAWSRVVVGVHYPFDVVAGALYGTVIGVLLARALPLLAEGLLRSLRARRQG